MKGVTVVDHPLVQHKLTLMRKKDTSTKSFRQLLKEIGSLICYEVTRDLPLPTVEIETPAGPDAGATIAGKKLVFAAILRSGMGMLDGHAGPGAGRARGPRRPLSRSGAR
jgi:uracil phosphoribosyltransferase